MTVTSGSKSIDEFLGGGFFFPSIISFLGRPGTGKTTMAMQIMFAEAKKGHRSLYITGLTEPAWSIISHHSSFDFFNPKYTETDVIEFLNLNDYVLKGDQDGFMQSLSRAVELTDPRVIVFDPIDSLKMIGDDRKYRIFIHRLFSYLHGHPAVSIFIGSSKFIDIDSVETYLVDGIIEFTLQKVENIRSRYMDILKLRGRNHYIGMRKFDLNNGGICLK